MDRIDDVLKKIYKRVGKRFRMAFVASIIAGLVAHIYMFTNKLPNFDDLIGINGFGATFRNGRWFLWVVGAIAYHLDLVFSLPWINGLITLLLLGTSAGIMADLLGMKSRSANALLGAVLVVFPSWTGTFFYMFTAPYYALAVLLSIVSVQLMVRCKKGFILSVLLLACSLGIYQSYLPFTATFYVVLLFLMLFEDRYGYWDILKRALLYLCNLFLGVLLYFACMKLSLMITGQELTTYKGISSMGRIELSRIPEILKTIAVNFFGIFLNNNMEISYNYLTKGMYFTLFAISIILIVRLLVQLQRRGDTLKAVETVVLSVIYVLAINSIYIMCEDGIYSLMYFSYVFLLIFPLTLLDRCLKQQKEKLSVFAEYAVTLVTAVGILSYCHFANGQYVSMQLSFNQALSYYTTMITQIKELDGYQEDMKVVFSGADITDKTLYHNEIMNTFSMTGRDDALADAYSKQNFILHYCGFQAELAEASDLSVQSQKALEHMPTYPNSGSIQIMDHVVVVKLSDDKTED